MQEDAEPQQLNAAADFKEGFSRSDCPDVLWRARHLVPSAYLEHLPLLFRLVSILQPKETLTLGFADGVAHFAACQALERNGAHGSCRALRLTDAPEGEQNRKEAEQHNAANYAGFSAIECADEETAHEHVRAGSMDLLIFEQVPSSRLREIFETSWLPCLSDRAVVLVPHGPDATHWLEGLRRAYPHIDFPHGGGVTALMTGDKPTAEVQRLFGNGASPRTRLSIQRFFQRIGQLQSLEYHHAQQQGRADAETEKALNNRHWAMRLQRERDELQKAYDIRHIATATTQARLLDMDRQIEALQETCDRHAADNRALRAQLDAARQNETLRFSEIAALTRALEEQTTARQAAERELASLQVKQEVGHIDTSKAQDRPAGAKNPLSSIKSKA